MTACLRTFLMGAWLVLWPFLASAQTVGQGAGGVNPWAVKFDGTGTNNNVDIDVIADNLNRLLGRVRITDGTNLAVVTATAGGSLQVECTAGCGGAATFVDGASTFTQEVSSVNAPAGFLFDDTVGTALTENDIAAGRITAARAQVMRIEGVTRGTYSTLTGTSLDVNCTGGCGSGTTFVDGAGTFTQEASSVNAPSGFLFDDTVGTALTENDIAAARITAARAQVFRLEGVTRGTYQTLTGTAADVNVTGGALAANQSVNVAQIAGTGTVTGGVAGLLAVAGNVANAGTATANPVPVGGIFTTTPATLTTGKTATLQFTAAQNAKYDITTIAGTAPTTAGFIDIKGADANVFVRQTTAANLNAAVVGTGTAGAPAGNILTVQGVASMTKLLVTPDALPANQSVNLAQVGATTVVTGGLAGSLAIGGTAATNAAINQNPLLIGGEALSTQPAAATTGNQRRTVVALDGSQYVRLGGPIQWSCFVQAVGVTTECRAAPGAGLRAYVVSAAFSNQAVAENNLDIVFGTGTNCATGITALTHKWQTGTNATTTSPQTINAAFIAPLVPTAANAICIRPSAATAFGGTLTGYDAP